MLFTLLPVVVGVLVGWLRGGRLAAVADAGLRGGWLLVAGFGLQIALDLLAARGVLPGTEGYPLLLLSQLLVGAWVVRNHRRPGVALVGLGLLANALVIGANGAMPVDPEAIVAAGGPEEAELRGKHVLADDATALRPLADVIPVRPIGTVVSVGDIVLAVGLVPLLAHLMRGGPDPRGRRRRPARSDPSRVPFGWDPPAPDPPAGGATRG
ncbi:MAG: DUF5317 domain-containing protein [Actinomycetes bacterium]